MSETSVKGRYFNGKKGNKMSREEKKQSMKKIPEENSGSIVIYGEKMNLCSL